LGAGEAGGEIGFDSWAVLEWECCVKDAAQGAKEGAEFIESMLIDVPTKAFDDFAGGEPDEEANRKILGTADAQPALSGMGTTITALRVFLEEGRYVLGHVGDSRAYRMRGGQLDQVTLDHSLLQELVDRGFYSAEEAQRSTNRNYVTRALGVEPTVEVEVHEHEVLPGDIYLLCSDGLCDMVEDDDIHLTISTFNDSLDVVGQQLVDLANDHGGRDNISVMLAQVKEAFPAEKGLLARIAGLFRS